MGNALTVAYFIECSEHGGAERVVIHLASGFRARGVGVVVITLKEGWLNDQLRLVGIEPVLLPSERRLDLGLPFRLASILRDRGANILHSHLLDANFYGSFGARIAGLPHVATDHGDVHLPTQKKLLNTKIRIAASLGTVFTGVSQFTRDALVALGASSMSTRTLYNPVTEPVSIAPSKRQELRREVGVEEPEWLWIHVAMLRPVKDQQTLLRGFAKSCQRLARQRLVLVGEGEDREALGLLAEELGIAQRVTFCGVRNDVSTLLAAADGFVLTSRSEALPMTILEAAMAGLPVVSSRVGGVPEIIRDGENGFLFAPGDEVALSHCLTETITNRERSQAAARRAQAEFVRDFSLDAILDRYQEVYAELLARPRAGGA